MPFLCSRLDNGDVRVGVHADLAGNRERPSYNVARLKIGGLHQCTCSRERVGPTRADRKNPVIRLDDVACPGNDEPVLAGHDNEQRLQPPEHAVATPVLGQVDSGTWQIVREAFQLLLELLEEREGVSGRTGETRQKATVLK